MPVLWVFETDLFVVQKGLFLDKTSKIVFTLFILTIYDMGIQGVTKGLRGVTGGYKGLQGVTKGLQGVKGVTKGYKGLQGVRGGDKGLQEVT